MNSNSSEVHNETRNIFENHPQILSKKGKKIARELDQLRIYRNLVDYDCEKPEDIKFVYNYCKSRSKIVLKILEELN